MIVKNIDKKIKEKDIKNGIIIIKPNGSNLNLQTLETRMALRLYGFLFLLNLWIYSNKYLSYVNITYFIMQYK